MKTIRPLFLAAPLAFLPALPTPAADAAAESKPPHPHGREAALADVKKLSAGAGLEARLFACEPDVVNAADMDVDARGRVWICEGANYRATFQKWGILRPGGDRIVILEDTNRDGRPTSKPFFIRTRP